MTRRSLKAWRQLLGNRNFRAIALINAVMFATANGSRSVLMPLLAVQGYHMKTTFLGTFPFPMFMNMTKPNSAVEAFSRHSRATPQACLACSDLGCMLLLKLCLAQWYSYEWWGMIVVNKWHQCKFWYWFESDCQSNLAIWSGWQDVVFMTEWIWISLWRGCWVESAKQCCDTPVCE